MEPTLPCSIAPSSQLSCALQSWGRHQPHRSVGSLFNSCFLCQQPPPGTMETFFKRHFGKKGLPGPRRASVVAVPTGKARRRSQAGLPSASLAQRRRGSGAPLPALSCLPLPRRRGPRRRSSTTPPCLSPRFAVQQQRGGCPPAINATLLGPSVLLAGFLPTGQEGAGDASNSWSAEDGDGRVDRGRRWAEESWLGVLPRLRPLQARLLTRGPRCLRRTFSHRLPTDVGCSRAPHGLPGRYRRLSQRRRSSDVLWPGLLATTRTRWLAQQCAGAAFPECLGPEPACCPDGWSPRLLYVWRCAGGDAVGREAGVGREGWAGLCVPGKAASGSTASRRRILGLFPLSQAGFDTPFFLP